MRFTRSLFATVLVVGAGVAPLSPVLAADSLGGAAVPGVCMLSQETVFAQSKVGQAAIEHLRQLAKQSGAPLDKQNTSLNQAIQSFQQKAGSLSEEQRKQQGAALQQRMQAFQSQAGQFKQRIQLTRAKAMQRIGQEAEPIIASVYKSHHCGLLLNRDAVLGGNMTNDLTNPVVQGLDRKISTISFSLEPLPSGNASGK